MANSVPGAETEPVPAIDGSASTGPNQRSVAPVDADALPGPWRTVRGEPVAIRVLRAALANDEVAHAWLLLGPKGVGQSELVAALAAALNCPQPVAPDAGCGTCSTCERIMRGRHSVVETFTPEGANHLVDQVRGDWIPTASRTLSEGHRRVLHIVAADRMNEAAQNAFLKVLEEPPASAVWVLEAEDVGALLDTVVSRCRTLTVVPWGMEPLRARARELGVPPEQQEVVARAAMGSPARVADLAEAAVFEARWRHLGLIHRLASGGPGEVVPAAKELVAWAKSRVRPLADKNAEELQQWAEAYGAAQDPRAWPAGVKQRLQKRHQRLERQEQRRMLDLALDDIASYLRDLLVVGQQGRSDDVINLDHFSSLERDVSSLPVPAVVSGLRAIVTCRDALDRNGAPELQLERLLMSLALPIYAAAA